MPQLKDRQQQVAEGLSADLLGAQATLAAPPEFSSDDDVRRELRDTLREMQLLKQQMQAMGMNPTVAAAGATLPAGVTPAAVGASQQVEAAVQRRDEDTLKAAWAIEASVPIRIEPDDTEKQVYARRFARWDSQGRQGQQPIFPPRRYQVNGVVVWLEVGRVIHVPASLAALHEGTLTTPILDMIPAGEGRIGYWTGVNPFGV